MNWRLIVDEKPKNAAENMALDYAIFNLHKTPTLRLYSWNPPAVSIGRFQSLRDEVDLEYCRKNKIDYVRRITGGGAVFHEHELTYSFCIKEKNAFFPPDLHESYRAICGAVINGLSGIGINAEYKPINDLICNGKKVSGCAQTRKHGRILQHGTILMDVDVIKMFNVLKVPKEKISDKMISDVKDRVTSISAELKRDVPPEELAYSIADGFKKTFGIKFTQSSETEEEKELMKKAEKDIFRNNSWLFER